MSESIRVPVAFASGGDGVVLPIDARRAVPFSASLHRPGVIRDALMALGDVLGSDLRRKANDRATYLQYLIGRGKAVTKQVWDAQREFLALQYAAVAQQDEPLDPIVSADGGALRFEVLSRDESTYAQLVLRPSALATGSMGTGTTFVDLAGALPEIGKIRSFRPTTIAFGTGASAPSQRAVPLRWLRAFGQMQAAALLATDRFEVSPVDLYNVLYALRTRKAKTAPRGLRYELVPGEPPRLVLEPWDLVVHGTSGPYRGSQPRVVRTWGRARLAALARILPHARRLEIALAGPGLPAIYVADLGDASLSLALSGWTDAGWAGVATFDLLAADDDPRNVDALTTALAAGPRADDALATALGRSRSDVRRTLLAALAQLRVGRDLATGHAYARSLLAELPPPSALQYSDAREAAAHRLLAAPGAVTVTKLHDLGADGRAIEGQIVDAAAHRTFYPSFTLDREGRTTAATCTCPAVRRAGIKEGPCEHMIALRVQIVRDQARAEAARDTPEGRAQIQAETRTLLRRTPTGALTVRLTLDGRNVVARGGDRVQRLRFDTADDARTAYFARLEQFAQKGFLDATQD